MSQSMSHAMRRSAKPLVNSYSSSRRPIGQSVRLLTQRRPASTTTTAASSTSNSARNIVYGISATLLASLGYLYVTDTRASIHQWLVIPSLRWLYPDAEDAHHAGTKLLKLTYSLGINIRERPSKVTQTDLSTIVFGQKLQNPIGISAGLDKLADVPDALFALGPAIVEVGGCTPRPQEGNPKPRFFRLVDHESLINRYGLNSLGADHMAMQLRERVRLFAYHNGLGAGEEGERKVLNGEASVPPGSLQPGKILMVQVAKNKDTPGDDIEAVKKDYVYCVERVAPYADVIVVNVSSPNTPGLRSLQQVGPLKQLLKGVVECANSVQRKTKPPVMVKVSPDEDTDEQIEGIVEAVLDSGVAGVIVGNTTNRRTNFVPQGTGLTYQDQRTLKEQGGLSGPHMFERTRQLVAKYRYFLDGASHSTSESSSVSGSISTNAEDGRKVVFASGGVTNGQQALQVLKAGADAVQIYTTMVYNGAGTVTRIKKEMVQEIKGSESV
ncbi:dihydroorotate reductase [Phlyctema vagabunda]|uniref:Dihydroorotate reductase n=1 Tax=Phlyctema vagabunda TaxID=108571 RepID=A0ABR4P3Y3_9HELO